MTEEKFLAHGNIKVTIQDAHLDVVSEPPSQAKNIAGFVKVWVVADVYVFRKGKNHKQVANQRDTFPNGITFTVPIPPDVLTDPFVTGSGKERLALVYYNKSNKKWVRFRKQEIDLKKNIATVTIKKWIKDPPIGWGGIDVE
jgi:hypothetical protein